MLSILLLVQTGNIGAQEVSGLSFTPYLEGSNAKIFNEKGFLVEDASTVNAVHQGWIIQTLDRSVELTLSLGAMRIGPQSIIAIDSLSADEIRIYVVRGSIRALSDADTRITLSTAQSSYTFTEGDYILEAGTEQRFTSVKGLAEARVAASDQSFEIPAEGQLATGASESVLGSAEAQQIERLTTELPIQHYERVQLAVTAAVEPVEPEPEPQTVAEAVEPEPEPEPEAEPVTEPEIDQPTEEPEIIIAKEEPVEEPAPEEVTEEVPLAREIELLVAEDTAETAGDANDSDSGLTAELALGFGLMHELKGSSSVPYAVTTLYPRFMFGPVDLGLRLSVAFNDNPLAIENWYRERDNLLWNFGGGAAGFEGILDIVSDSLSLIDHVLIGAPDSGFYLRIDDSTPLSFGHGVLMSELLTAIDAPYIHRAGLYQSVTTPFYDHELLIDDITYARIYGARFALRPFARSYPFTLGISALADIDYLPTEMVITPALDLTLPVIATENHSFSVIADAAALMVYEDNTFDYLASYDETTGLENILVSAGLSGKSGGLSYQILGVYDKGNLSLDMFGDDYQWRRDTLLEGLYDDGYASAADALEFGLKGTAAYDLDQLHTRISYYLPIDAATYDPQFDSDRLSFRLSGGNESFSLYGGFSSDGLISSLIDDSFSLFTPDTRLFGGLTLTTEDLSFTAAYAQIAQYSDPDSDGRYTADASSVTPVLSLETTIRLGDLEDLRYTDPEDRVETQPAVSQDESPSWFSLTGELGIKESIDSSVYASPYTSLYLYPSIQTESFDAGLKVGIDTNGNPLDTASWLYEAGNTPYDFYENFGSSDFHSVRETVIDILSLIDHARINEPGDTFYLRVSDSDDITFSHGSLISHLNTSIDAPFINRTGFYSELDTALLDTELMINDLSNPQLMAAGIGITPTPNGYAFELGVSALIDLTFKAPGSGTSATQMLLIPGFDLTLPLHTGEDSRIAAFGELNVMTIVDDTFHTDGFMNDTSFYNTLVTAGIEAAYPTMDIRASLARSTGNLTGNLFGADYAWRRAAIYDLYDDTDYLTDKGLISWTFAASLDYHRDLFAFSAFLELDFDDSFTIDFDTTSAASSPDLIGINVSYQGTPLAGSAGIVMRGLSYNIRPGITDFTLFDESVQLFADISYTFGLLEVYGRFSSIAEYANGRLIDPYTAGNDNVTGTVVPSYSFGTRVQLL
ncbi:MAG: hypothetical protein K9M84_03005 [Spirochaetia bacterium]|nr:hypothetical protein [Spirochaetia bacterium]